MGRPSGSRNKTTIQRELREAAARQIDDARDSNIEYGKDVLARLMKVAEGATSLHRPTTKADAARGAAVNPDGDWDRFGTWFDRTAYCAKELAKYQSPQLRAIMTAPAPAAPSSGSNKRFTLTIYDRVEPPRTVEIAPPLKTG